MKTIDVEDELLSELSNPKRSGLFLRASRAAGPGLYLRTSRGDPEMIPLSLRNGMLLRSFKRWVTLRSLLTELPSSLNKVSIVKRASSFNRDLRLLQKILQNSLAICFTSKKLNIRKQTRCLQISFRNIGWTRAVSLYETSKKVPTKKLVWEIGDSEG